jgi:hypothetical protein
MALSFLWNKVNGKILLWMKIGISKFWTFEIIAIKI